MPEKAWKASERAIAGALNGRRVPVSGRGRGDQPDVAHGWLSVECKSRASVPAWLLTAVAQAKACATPAQLPVAVIHVNGRRHARDLVVMEMSGFKEWFGDRLAGEGEA